MPTPGPGETRDDFMDRCIPELIGEGKLQDQAVAICSNLFSDKGNEKLMTEKSFSFSYGPSVKITIDPETSRVQRIDFVGGEDLQVTEFLGSLGVTESGPISVEMYAPLITTKFSHIAEVGEENVLFVKGIPFVAGVHRGITYSDAVVASMAPMLEDAPILVDHQFNEAFRSIKGKVTHVDAHGANIIVTARIDDKKTQMRILSGELHSFSVRILTISNAEKIAIRLAGLAELTVTGEPIVPAAVLTDKKMMPVPVTFTTDKGTIAMDINTIATDINTSATNTSSNLLFITGNTAGTNTIKLISTLLSSQT